MLDGIGLNPLDHNVKDPRFITKIFIKFFEKIFKMLSLQAPDSWVLCTHEKLKNLAILKKRFANMEMSVKMVWVYVKVFKLITEVFIWEFLFLYVMGAKLIHMKNQEIWAITKIGLVNAEMSVKRWCEYTWGLQTHYEGSHKIFWEFFFVLRR